MFPENSARWSQIRNALLLTINPDNLNVFNVKLTRSLKRLEKYGDIIRVEEGHKKVIYKLTPSMIDQNEIAIFPLLIGAFNPLDKLPTYEEFKKRALEAINFEYEYKQFKKDWESFQNIRNLKSKR